MTLMPPVFKDIRHLVDPPGASELTDRQLLERFANQGDDRAFTLLVRRHGPLVLSVCRRVLGSFHDAEDAFQATFLVLARKAGSVRWHESVGGWLFPVAFHLALKMKAQAKRRRADATALDEIVAPAADGVSWELRTILDEELTRLPESYRAVLVLCHCQGRTRAEAAQQLGWKAGTVKIRLERARALLRARLTRRGLALSAGLLASALAEGTAIALPSAALVNSTVDAAREFAAGTLSVATTSTAPAQLAEGALKAMMRAKLKIFAVVALVVGILGTGAGLWTLRALADEPPPEPAEAKAGVPAAVRPSAEALAEPENQPDIKQLRVLLVAGGPTKEYQFLRRLLVNETARKRAELSIFLQSGEKGAVQDVPAERLLRKFPNVLEQDPDKVKAEEKAQNLLSYDVIVAIDPDWTQVPKDDLKLLEAWVRNHRGGLIFVASPINTYQLARVGNQDKLEPLLALLPIVLEDSRLVADRSTAKPWPLHFPGITNDMGFLKLDEQGKEPLAGWSEFFHGKPRNQVKADDPAERGFHTNYPIKGVRPAATVIATYADPAARYTDEGGIAVEQPYLATLSCGKGRSFYVSAGEMWRLRLYSEDYYNRFWSGLLHYVASDKPVQARKASDPLPELAPAQRKAIERGLKHLAKQQFRDGHWETADGDLPVAMTALAGMALLMEGSTLTQGEHQDQIRRAVDFLIDRAQRNGLIGNPHNPTEKAQYMIGHGFGMLFLASVYGEEEDGDRRLKLTDVLSRAVEFTGKAQLPDRGWGYVSFVDGETKSLPLLTVFQLQALRASRAAGIHVPAALFDRAQTYLRKDIDADTPQVQAWAALAGTFAAGEYDTPLARKWLRAAEQRSPELGKGGKSFEGEYLNAYHAQVMYALGQEGYAKLYPDVRPEQRLTWLAYRKSATEHLAKAQKEDGGWDHRSARLTPRRCT
jgi:RNA polymerase sigma factor (sigma-70 family)